MGPDSLFEYSARKSEYLDRGAVVFVTKHQRNSVRNRNINPDQCVLQVNGATLKQVEKFKYLGVAFTTDGRQDEELDTRIGKANAVMRALHYSVVMKREL